MILALIIATSLSLLRPGAESPVTIAPAALTFPEIARALSAKDRTVVCGAGLRNRAAVVALRGRPWEEARRALGEGLGVRIRPHPDIANTWLMESDPDEAARERTMRTALAKLLRDAVEKETAPYGPTLGQPIHRLIERAYAVHYALEGREKADPDHANEDTKRLAAEDESLSRLADPFTQVAARLSHNYTLADYEAAIAGPQPFRLVNIQRIADVGAICRLMMQAMAREAANRPKDNDAPDTGTGNPLFDDQEVFRLLERVAMGRITVYQRLYVSPTPFRVTVQQLYVIGDQFAFRHGISAAIDDDATVGRVLEGMGPDAKARLAADRSGTAAWLATRAANQPFTLRWTDEIACLSSVVEEWARQTNGEVVMELAPGSEGIGMLHSPETGGDADPPPATIQATLAAATRSADVPWSFRDSGGAAIVRNPLDFVDRTRDLPMGPLLKLQRARTGTGEPGLFTLPEVAQFHAACTAEESASLANCLSPYRGVNVLDLASSRFVAALDRLAPQARAAAERRLEMTGECDIPLAAFRLRDQQEMTATLRAASLASEHGSDDATWLTDFPRLLQAGIFRLTKGEGTVEVSLLIPPPVPRIGEPATIATATIALHFPW